ncbi:tubulin-dependent ATPase KIP3 PWA37_004778 [Arxiozyma heterogenica]|uniref:tubulin-dependent ATPase KIP3 n=1 Tax=Arxiozyma heterogenica TaxID=278026 RepID=UPI002F0765B8
MKGSKAVEGLNRQSSITVAVRIRPFNQWEISHLIPEERSIYANGNSTFKNENDNDSRVILNQNSLSSPLPILPQRGVSSSSSSLSSSGNLYNDLPRPNGIWSLVNCVDDKMLIFNPNNRNVNNNINNINNINNSINNSGKNNNTALKYKRNHTGWRQRSTSNSRYNSNSNDNGNGNSGGNNETKFIFDKLFDMRTEQETIYNSLMVPLLDSVMDGYNGTIFAYGATGCGKTYTINGTADDPGIIYRTMNDLFKRIKNLQNEKDFEILLSFLEIYNENIRDLLDPDTPSHKLVIREDSNQKILVSNLSYHSPRNVEDVLSLVERGNKNRTTCPTGANLVSSRSHSILQIQIVQNDKMIDLTNVQSFGTLSIIDLAGSERAAATKNRGQRLFEGAKINQSLLALGNCINALCSDTKKQHVPYRDSKLTRLLKFSLGGNCKTVMIVCISPSSQHYEETLNTLKYANRAKQIKTKMIKNQQNLNRHISSYLKIINEQKKVIRNLQNREYVIEKRIYDANNEIYDMIQVIKKDIILATNNDNNNNNGNMNIINSLILVKRRLLQFIKLKVSNDNRNNGNNFLDENIKRLEQQFNSNEKQINERIRFISDQYLLKFKQHINTRYCEQNQNQREESLNYYIKMYNNEVNEIMSNYNKNVLIGATDIMEELMNGISDINEENDILSIIKAGNIFDNDNTSDEVNEELIIKEFDKKFDRFALKYLSKDDHDHTTTIKMNTTTNNNANNNILIPSYTEDISLQDITMIRE